MTSLHRFRFRLSSSVVLAALAGFAACAPKSRAPAAPALRATDDWGRTVALAAPARRIVSLAPASTELVFALGLGRRLVGRTTWDDFPAEAARVRSVGNGIGPNVEAVLAQRPDLVLLYASEANRQALGRFAALALPVLVLKLDLAADLRRAARLIATLAGVPAAGDSLVQAFDTALAGATRPAPAAPPGVYVDVEENPPITIGRGSYLSEIIAAAGARNVFGDIAAGSGPVSLEAIVQRDPDVIVALVSDTTRLPRLAARPGWRAVRAVREGRVVPLDGRLYGRPSPRMPQAVRDLAARLEAVRRADTARCAGCGPRAGP